MEICQDETIKIGPMTFGKREHCFNILTFISFLLICVYFFPYLSSWIHELSHFFLANLHGFQNVQLEVFYPIGGKTTFSMESYLPLDDPRVDQFRMVLISGSLGNIIFLILLLLFSSISRKFRFSLYFPIFLLALFMLLYEIFYWFTGINIQGTDPNQFLKITPQISPNELVLLILSILLLVVLVSPCLFAWKLHITIKKYL